MGFWDRIVEKNKNSFKDSMTGTWRSLKNGTSGDPSATMAEVRAARAERERQEQARMIEEQIEDWRKKLGRDAAGGFKAVYNPERGYTDIYYAGEGELPDGSGKGHIRVFDDGTESIIREPYRSGEPNAKRDATILDDNVDKRA